MRPYIPATRAGRTLVVVALTDSVGSGLYLAGSVMYLVRGVGLGTAEVGSGLTIAGLAGLAATVPLGVLGDRIGVKRLLVSLQLWRAVMLVALAFVHTFLSFVVVAIGLVIAARSVSPATQAVVAAVMSGGDRVSTMAIMRSVRNVGYSIGAALTVPVFAVDSLWAYRSILLGNAATFVASVLLLLPLRVVVAPDATAGRNRIPAGFRDWRFLRLAALNGFFSLHMTMLAVAIPLWALATATPRWLVSVLLVLNTVLAVLLQVASARGSDQPGFGERALRRAAVALVGSCLLFAAAPMGSRNLAIAFLVTGTVAMTVGELYQSAGGWELSFRHSPPERRAEYLAAFNLGPAGQDILGPLLLTTVVALGSLGWVLLGLLFGGAAVLIRPAVQAVDRATVPAESA